MTSQQRRNLSMLKVMVPCLLVLLAVSCKKSAKKTPDTGTPPETANGTRAELTKDSIFLYAKQVYFWNDALPTVEAFNPRGFTASGSELTNFNSELFAISQYKINTTTGLPYEYTTTVGKPKYSYIQDRATINPVAYMPGTISAVDLEGNGNDLGIAVTGLYRDATNTTYDLYVRFVALNSPAWNAGIRRGQILSKLNGVAYGANFSAEVNAINSALAQTTLPLTRKVNGVETNLTLTKAVYKSSPIFASRVIDTLGKKIGYIAYARFSSAENSEAALTTVFSGFKTAGVTALIIDLRYNGGGYVSTAQHLTDLIAPGTLTGSTMFSETYNSTMQANNARILANQPQLDDNDKVQYVNGRIRTYADADFSLAKHTYKFAKKGALENITNVAFIVTGNTASASELVINNLKPHMNVKIFGAKSYGKPIGFFPIRIGNYNVYYSMFQTRNSAGEGDYFTGFTPDKTTFDDVTRDFGNSKESSTLAAINYIATNTISSVSASKESATVSASGAQAITIEIPGEFKGAIENRIKQKN
ncbi:S41 family peptidase [Hufsiella ginkgonis]|uniref:PDZ domain-containing protein n=1 Tax=Hufsiella ginkgonis TaxID=2695274 RepID=A0A7K1XZS9_9SPHI|nr:S41 family peptidase [Hufsiella ginkgonis]MXV16308.1 hypothetical protein [Hufsiella ginkgonis]